MRLIRLTAVLDKTGLSRSVIYEMMNRGEFPRPAKLYPGARANLWPESEVEAWIASRLEAREAA